MNSVHGGVRITAIGAPILLFLYGPLVFQVGVLGLLVMLVVARIPIGALIVLCGLSPLARRSFIGDRGKGVMSRT